MHFVGGTSDDAKEVEIWSSVEASVGYCMWHFDAEAEAASWWGVVL